MLWGYADTEGDTVTARVVGQGSAVTTHVQNGKWKVKLPAITDPGPFVVDVRSSDGHVTLNDVLFGDVWVCSGQSNMGFTMRRVSIACCLFLCWLLNVPATCQCISGTDLLRQLYVLPH